MNEKIHIKIRKMRKAIKFSIILSTVFFLSSGIDALAKTKTFIREYTYNASEADSKLSASGSNHK